MKALDLIISSAKAEFRSLLEMVVQDGGLTREQYQRFLSMQFHLTKGVQRHFFLVASHTEMSSRKSLRNFLVEFGDQEEQHYLIAKRDLENLQQELLEPCLDVQIWWRYFDAVVQERPFLRLGATCILENISGGSSDLIASLLKAAPWLNPRNTRFLVSHQHEELPHGDQILDALGKANLTGSHINDLEEGARVAVTIYLRMFRWVMTGREVR